MIHRSVALVLLAWLHSGCRDEKAPVPTTTDPSVAPSSATSAPVAPSMVASTETPPSIAPVPSSVAEGAVPADAAHATTSATKMLATTTVTTTTAPPPTPTASTTTIASASATASATSSAVVSTPSTTGAHYAVWMQGATAKVGASSFVDIVLVPQGGYHCNEQYPHKFKLGSPSAGVTFPQPMVTAISYSAKRTTMRIPFVATSAGTATISGKFTFAVCTADTCEPASAPLSIAVKVE